MQNVMISYSNKTGVHSWTLGKGCQMKDLTTTVKLFSKYISYSQRAAELEDNRRVRKH